MTRKFVGQATARLDGPAKVTGKSQYSGNAPWQDITQPLSPCTNP